MASRKDSNSVVAYNLAGKFVLNGINFLVVSVFVRLMGTENFGLFSLYVTWENILVILVGLQTQSIIGNVTMRFPANERSGFLSSNVVLCVALSVLWGIFILCFRNQISLFTGLPIAILFFMLLHAFTNYCVNLLTGVWSFDLEARRQFWVSVLLSLVNIGLSLCLIINISEYNQKYLGRIIGSAVPTIIFGAGCAVYLLKEGRVFFNKKYLHYTLGFSIPIVFHALSNLVLGQSDRIMLQKMGTLSDVGVYSILFTLNNLIIILMEAFNSAWVPYFYRDLKEGNVEVLKKKTSNYVWLFSLIIVGFILVSPEVLRFYGGKDSFSRLFALPFLTIGSAFVFLYSFPINYKYYKGKTKSIAIGTVFSGLFNVMLNFILIPKFGIYGAAWATAVSYFFLWVFHHIGAVKLDGTYPYKLRQFLKPLIIIIIVAFVSYAFMLNFVVLRWLLATIVGIIILFTLYKRKSVW